MRSASRLQAPIKDRGATCQISRPTRIAHQPGQHRPRRSPHQHEEGKPMFKSTFKLVRYALSTLASTGLGVNMN
jgi:hypothetical protein